MTQGSRARRFLQYDLRTLFACLTLSAIGAALCSVNRDEPYWGNWIYSGSFSIGLVFVIIAMGLFLAKACSQSIGLFVACALLFLLGALIWTFPGRMLTHEVLSRWLG